VPLLAGSELAKLRGEALPASLPPIDIAAVRATQIAVRDAVRSRAVSSAHDVAEGGLATALAECCLAGNLGCEVTVEDGHEQFGETVGLFIVSGPSSALRECFAQVRHQIIGSVGGADLRITAGGAQIDLALERLRAAHGALARLFD